MQVNNTFNIKINIYRYKDINIYVREGCLDTLKSQILRHSIHAAV